MLGPSAKITNSPPPQKKSYNGKYYRENEAAAKLCVS